MQRAAKITGGGRKAAPLLRGATSRPPKRRPRRKRGIAWMVAGAVLLALCGGLFAVQASTGESAASVTPNPRGQPAEAGGQADEKEPATVQGSSARVDWRYWQSVNPDIVAWVSIEGTSVNYAVVQAPADDPTYYLDHDIYRSWSPYGCPYVDAACNGTDGASTVVFGHNMGHGTTAIFADFAQYSDESFARSHPVITLETPAKTIKLRVSAADVVEGSSPLKRTEFATAEDMRKWYSARFSACKVRISNEERFEQLFSFVTCSYTTYANERTIVYAQPISSEKTKGGDAQGRPST